MEHIKNRENLIEGKNAVLEAYNSGRGIKKLYVQKGLKDERINKLIESAKKTSVIIKFLEKEELDSLSSTKANQGIVAEVEDYKYVEVDEIIDFARSKGEDPYIIILDEIQDPHNFGAIIRSVDVIGAHGIIVKNRNQAMVTSVVASSSAGAVNFVKIARVNNLSKTIEELKDKGFWIASADMGGDDIEKHNYDGSFAIVFGNEGDGVSRLVKEKCDFSVSIPMKGHVDSFNVSVAAGIMMYEISKLRANKSKG